MLTLSWVAALVACLGYGSGSVLQSIGARRAEHATGLSGAARIMLQLPYLVGIGVDGVAFVANVLAVQRLPLFLVQAIVTASVGVTAILSALRGSRLTGRDLAALGVLGLGLLLLAVAAREHSAVEVSLRTKWLVLASSGLTAALGLLGLRLPRRVSGVVIGLASGLGFSGVAVASRGISGGRVDWSLLANPLLWAILVQGALALVWFALALQRGGVTTISAVTFLVEMVVPSVVGLAVFGDAVTRGLSGIAAMGFALSVAGVILLARYAEA